jgi:hypothetical protein
MKNLLDQWLGDSISVLEYLEHEVGESHYAIQRALAEIRRHEDDIQRLEQKIAVIRRATAELDGAVEETQFEREFDDAFFAPENLVDDRHDPESMEYLDEDEDSNVVHVMPKAAAGPARLPPPPLAAARLRR